MERLRAERIAEDLGVLAPARVLELNADVRRRVRSRHWQRVGRCVVMHNGPITPDQLMWAAVLSPEGTAALARESGLRAGGVRGLGDPNLCVATPWGRTPAAIPGVTYVRTRILTPQDLVPGGLPPRMTAARCLIDAASRATRDRARTLIAMTVQQKRATPEQLRAVLDRLSSVHQEVLVRLTIDDVEGGAHSLPELRFTRLMRASGLPMPSRQTIRQRPDGRYYLDVEWEEFNLAGEVDGAHHRDAQQWEADVLRHDELMIGGDRVLRLLSWWVRDRPELVVDLVGRALRGGGWTG
jgi:very-short-patch-repair endonuclease